MAKKADPAPRYVMASPDRLRFEDLRELLEELPEPFYTEGRHAAGNRVMRDLISRAKAAYWDKLNPPKPSAEEAAAPSGDTFKPSRAKSRRTDRALQTLPKGHKPISAQEVNEWLATLPPVPLAGEDED